MSRWYKIRVRGRLDPSWVEWFEGMKIKYPNQDETVLRGLGELHVRLVVERMQNDFGLEVATRPPKIAYRETVGQRADGHSRHKKQTGGAGQFGEVFLRIEPLARGAGFEFASEVVGGAIPTQYIPAVEKGVRQVLEHGAIAGYQMQDVRVIVYDGKYHPVDSKEVAFVSAGKKAFLDAIAKAKPQVLEPIVNLEVFVPDSHMGDVTGGLASKRARSSNGSLFPACAISSIKLSTKNAFWELPTERQNPTGIPVCFSE